MQWEPWARHNGRTQYQDTAKLSTRTWSPSFPSQNAVLLFLNTSLVGDVGLHSHEAAHHLFSVLRASGVCEADERAVDRDPGTPLQLQHTTTDKLQKVTSDVLRGNRHLFGDTTSDRSTRGDEGQ